MTITVVQFLMLAATGLLFASAFFLGLAHMRRVVRALADAPGGLPHDVSMGNAARAAVAAATLLGFALIVWRTASQSASANAVIPGSNPFDAFLILSLLLALAVMYLRWTRHLRSLAFFLLPMICALLLLGLIIAAIHQNTDAPPPDVQKAWLYVHLVTIVGSTVCFALAFVGGILYLLADRQLRHKGLPESHRWLGLPPLGSIEKLNRWMVYTGFPLLTIATVAGIVEVSGKQGTGLSTKMGIGILAWIVYGVLLHVPLNPRFRGRRAAWLAVVGFVVFMAAFAAARWS